MAISTFDDLKSAISGWASRTDLGSRLDDFVALCEARIKSDDRLLLSKGEVATDFSISSDTTALPDGFLGIKRIHSSTNGKGYVYKHPSEFASILNSTYHTATDPDTYYYTIEGDNFRISPAPTAAITAKLLYHSLPALSVSNTTNWMLTAYPNVYLYGCLLEYYLYSIEDLGQTEKYAQAYDIAAQAAKKSDNYRNSGDYPRFMRPAVAV